MTAASKGTKQVRDEAQRLFLAKAQQNGWKWVRPELATPENLWCPIEPPDQSLIDKERIVLPFRSGLFKAITMDAPWNYQDRRFNGFADVQAYRVSPPYPCMHLYNIWQTGHEIRRVAHPDGCHLWPWGTCHFDLLMRAMLEAWGWTHKTIYPWVKTTDGLNRGHVGLEGFSQDELATAARVMASWGQHGKPAFVMGRWGRQVCEYLHLATSSNKLKAQNAVNEPALIMAPEPEPTPCPYCQDAYTGLPNSACENCMNTGLAEPSVIFGATYGHSRKPDAAFDLIRRNSPGPRLSMFEREKRRGFMVFGDEAPQ